MSVDGPEHRRIELRAAVMEASAGTRSLHYVQVQGCAASALIHGIRQVSDRPVLYVTKDSQSATRGLDDLAALGSGALRLPAWLRPGKRTRAVSYDLTEGSAYDEALPDRRREMARVAALYLFLSGRRDTLVVGARALARKCVPFSVLAESALTLSAGSTMALESTTLRLVHAGYLRTPLVEEPGELAVRGGLLDLWPTGQHRPVRVELSGDHIVSLKEFDPQTQKSGATLEHVVVPPAREVQQLGSVLERAKSLVQSLCDAVDYPTLKTRALLDDVGEARTFFGAQALLPAYYELVPLTRLIDPATLIVLEDPSAIVQAWREDRVQAEAAEARAAHRPHFPLSALYVDEADLMADLHAHATLTLHRRSVLQAADASLALESLEGAPAGTLALDSDDHQALELLLKRARDERGHESVLDPLQKELLHWSDRGYCTTLVARTAPQADRLATLLRHRNIRAKLAEPTSAGPEAFEPGSITIAVAPLARGALFASDGFVLLTEEEIFGQRRHLVRRARRQAAPVLDDLRTLEVDDYVVHVEHGIGRYKGLSHRKVGDIWLDLLVVEYQGGDKLFLPVYRLNQIQKHASSDAQAKLDRLGGQTFARTKAKVRRKVRDMADELLRLYAERMNVTRPPLPAPGDDYAAFEAAFPFEETPDQAGAIADVLADLSRDVVMDRLVCGDVGFGKTEVALRAAFLNVMDGRQVALLCPTTVLAQQHFLTFQARLAQYPAEIRVLSRFQSKKAVNDTLVGLANGTVDVVVGTHRLLSKDVHFKHLGLLIVDEEQRFGVAHKERIKQIKRNIDVLTLSATPIPRTLQMAVSGIRDLSMISTPPLDRRGIRTVITGTDDDVIRSAIERELGRGGQVFYVYNRIEGLESRAQRLRTLLPGVRVAVAHGKQQERHLERVMLDFVRGNYDVLCSTAIIESGLDIPRANTMLVDRADLLGLSQLYQLRGRIGRSHQQAYCYLMVPPPSRMSDVARARIDAMQRYTELGSGLMIANMDMELRGAGDLLGAEQSGFVQTVGFELFCQMLQEATQELTGHATVPDIDPDLSIDVEALIPDDYVDEIGVRLSLYKRLASAAAAEDVDAIASEIVDRFGPPPEAVRRLVSLMHLKVELRALRALGCEATQERVSLQFSQDTPLSASGIGALVASDPKRYSLSPAGRLTRRAAPSERLENGLEHASLLVSELMSRLASS